MFIDYIYLSLIIIKILFIIFLIYLSYEYRNIDCFMVPNINSLSGIQNNLSNTYNLTSNFNNEYKNLINEIDNRNIARDNIKNIELYKKTQKNFSDSEKLKELNNNIKNINIKNNNTYPIDKLIKTIKSKYNSQYLSTFSNDMKKYGILANDKCITVNGLCKDEFCLLDCQNNLFTSDSQKFSTKRITNNKEAASEMNVNVDRISEKNIYPYNIFKSLVNDNCLTISNEGITFEPCNLNNIRQQWEISPNENICILE
jgi:uncharacterized protein YoxC